MYPVRILGIAPYPGLERIMQQLAAIINAVFALLSILGVVNDPTTAGSSDSAQALTYEEPRKEG